MTHPILFLDIDGVLNNKRWDYSPERSELEKKVAEAHSEWKTSGSPCYSSPEWLEFHLAIGRRDLDPRNVRVLNCLAETENAEIVISSTWRKYYGLSQIRSLLGEKGLENPDRVISSTPVLRARHDFKSPSKGLRITRGMEIEKWLLTELDRDSLKETFFLILDDCDEFGRLKPYHIQTHGERGGFSEAHMLTAGRMLGRQRRKQPAGDRVHRKPNRHWWAEEGKDLYPDQEWKPDEEIKPCPHCGARGRSHKMSCSSKA